MEARCLSAGFEDGGRGQVLRNEKNVALENEGSKEVGFPLEPQEGVWPLISAQGNRYQSSGVQNHRVGGNLLQWP